MSWESFLTRWSQRKLTARRGDPVEPAPPAEQEIPATPAQLPPLDSISLDTGVAAFFRPGVEEGLRRLALKKLFSDPHFNVMDGLDVYIDDYSRKDPIPPDILERLVQAQTLLRNKDAGSAKADESLPPSDLPAADTALAPQPPPDTEDTPQAGG